MTSRPPRSLPGAVALLLAVAPIRAAAAVSSTPAADPLQTQIEQLKIRRDVDPSNDRLKEQLVLAYNAHGVDLAGHQQWETAINQFRQALVLRPHEAIVEQNLMRALVGSAYALYNEHKTAPAKRLLDEALRYPTAPFEALVLAGQLAYDNQRLKEAQTYWTKALKLQPDAEEVKARLAQLTRERSVEDQFGKVNESFFELRFDQGLASDSNQVMRDLADARRVVGQAFRYFPTQKIVVLIYAEDQFRQLHRDSPEWLGGQYDGKIRIPIRSQDPNTFRRILWHEYTHALIHSVSANRCPTWLNEGLAEHEGATQQPTPFVHLQQAAAASPPRVLNLPSLSAAFNQHASIGEAALAYEEARSFVGYLIERHGLWRLTRTLRRLGAGEDFERAFHAELHVPLSTAYKRWLAALPTLLQPSAAPSP